MGAAHCMGLWSQVLKCYLVVFTHLRVLLKLEQCPSLTTRNDLLSDKQFPYHFLLSCLQTSSNNLGQASLATTLKLTSNRSSRKVNLGLRQSSSASEGSLLGHDNSLVIYTNWSTQPSLGGGRDNQGKEKPAPQHTTRHPALTPGHTGRSFIFCLVSLFLDHPLF